MSPTPTVKGPAPILQPKLSSGGSGGGGGCEGARAEDGGTQEFTTDALTQIEFTDLTTIYDDNSYFDIGTSELVIPSDGDYIYAIKMTGGSGPGYLAAIPTSGVQERISFPDVPFLYAILVGGPRRMEEGDRIFFMLQHDGSGNTWSLDYVTIERLCGADIPIEH